LLAIVFSLMFWPVRRNPRPPGPLKLSLFLPFFPPSSLPSSPPDCLSPSLAPSHNGPLCFVLLALHPLVSIRPRPPLKKSHTSCVGFLCTDRSSPAPIFKCSPLHLGHLPFLVWHVFHSYTDLCLSEKFYPLRLLVPRDVGFFFLLISHRFPTPFVGFVS